MWECGLGSIERKLLWARFASDDADVACAGNAEDFVLGLDAEGACPATRPSPMALKLFQLLRKRQDYIWTVQAVRSMHRTRFKCMFFFCCICMADARYAFSRAI